MSPFNVPYSSVSFMEQTLNRHQKVASSEREQHHFFRIKRRDGKSPINCVVLDEYTLGVADIFKALKLFPDANCVVTVGDWNAYTSDAKEYGRQVGVGVFKSTEFFGALWRDDFINYVKKEKDDGSSSAADLSA